MTSTWHRLPNHWLTFLSLLVLLLPHEAWAFDGSDVVLDPATGLEWLDVSYSVDRSYDDLIGLDGSNEFAPGGDFEGFRHATVAEGEAFLANAGFNVFETPSTDLYDEAISLQGRLGGPTFVNTGVEHLFAMTGDNAASATSRDRIRISVDTAMLEGTAGANGAFLDSAANSLHGHLLVRNAAPLPQRTVYVARIGQVGIDVIDVATQTVVDTVATGRLTAALAVSPDQRRVYTLEASVSTVGVIDTETRAVVDRFSYSATGFVRDLVTSANGDRLFLSDNNTPGQLIVLDTSTGATLPPIPVQAYPYALARSSDGTELFVTSANTLEVQVVDLASEAVVAGTPNTNLFTFAIGVGEETGTIYGTRSSVLSEVDPVTLASTASVGVGRDIRGIAARDRIGRVFVASNDDATVEVIEMDTFDVVSTISTGTLPLHGGILSAGIEVTDEGDLVYAAQGGNDTVVAIDTLSNQVVAAIPAGDTPIDVVIVPESSASTLGACALGLLGAMRWRASSRSRDRCRDVAA